jgi:hypothetical protein
LNVSQVLIDRPHARVTIDEAGVVNVVNAFAPVEKEKKQEEGKREFAQTPGQFPDPAVQGPHADEC